MPLDPQENFRLQNHIETTYALYLDADKFFCAKFVLWEVFRLLKAEAFMSLGQVRPSNFRDRGGDAKM
jgi:hypothetical protein